MGIKVACLTSDKGLPYLPGFFHQWEKYADAVSLDIVGFTQPAFDLPYFAKFVSMGRFEDYPAYKWSNAVMEYLDGYVKEDQILIVLEDYWLIRPVNFGAIMVASNYMERNPGVMRCDLTTDRVYSNAILRDIPREPNFGITDLIETDPGGEYSFSLQAALWNTKLFRWILRKDESPWDTELIGTGRLAKAGSRVIGTRQNPMNYLIACNKGKFDPSGAWMYPARTLAPADFDELRDLGLLPL